MSKTVYFTVALTFDKKIKGDDGIGEITDNIGNALLAQINSYSGLAPESSDTFTTKVVVTSERGDNQFESLIYDKP